jgi:hypothetical protein
MNYFSLDIFFYDLGIGKQAYYLIYTFFEYSAFAYLLWKNIRNVKFKKSIILLSIAFVVFQIVYFIVAPIKKMDSAPIAVETILILVFIFYFFFEQIKHVTSENIYSNPHFWIATGILIYLSGTFFFYILVNHLPAKQIQPYWYITYIFDLIKNLLITAGMLIFLSKSKSHSGIPKNIPYLDLN